MISSMRRLRGGWLRRWGRSGEEGIGPERAERFGGEDGLDREVEVSGHPEREVEARGVLSALDVADGLVVDAECLGELVAGDPAVRPQEWQTVVNQLAVALVRPSRGCRHFSPPPSGRASRSVRTRPVRPPARRAPGGR